MQQPHRGGKFSAAHHQAAPVRAYVSFCKTTVRPLEQLLPNSHAWWGAPARAAMGAVVLRRLLLLLALLPPSELQLAGGWALDDLLGGAMDRQRFLAEHWQVRPLFTNGSRVGGAAHRAKIQQLLSLAQLDAVGNSPSFSGTFKSVAENMANPAAADARAEWWDLQDVWPLAVYKQGFAGQQLQQVAPRMRSPTAEFAYSTAGDAYLDGATLVFSGLERFWQPVDALCAALIQELEWWDLHPRPEPPSGLRPGLKAATPDRRTEARC